MDNIGGMLQYMARDDPDPQATIEKAEYYEALMFKIGYVGLGFGLIFGTILLVSPFSHVSSNMSELFLLFFDRPRYRIPC